VKKPEKQKDGDTNARRGRPRGKSARKRSDVVADEIKRWIMAGNVEPGGALPNERDLAAQYRASKGTVREALKSLEVQGLIRIRTGPGGGASVTTVTPARAEELLGNYFYGTDLSLADIYAMRRVIEPMLAESVVGHLDAEAFAALDHSVNQCACTPRGVEEARAARMAELDFHDILAEVCPNPVLGFYCRFLNRLLKNLAVCERIYEQPNPELTAHGHEYHVQLMEAFRAGDAVRARRLMAEHIAEAERLMMESEAFLERRFLMPDAPPGESMGESTGAPTGTD